jgi:hypothetical protein
MHYLGTKLGALAVGGSIAALVLAAAPAQASTHSAGRWITGPEVVYGAAYGRAATANAPRIPLRLRGVVNTSDLGFVLGNGGGKKHVLRTRAGKLAVQITARTGTTASANRRTCRETFTEDQTFTVLGGRSTRAFAGASGPGAVQVYFAAFAPRYKSGPKKHECDFKTNRVRSKGAVARFLATSVLKVRR